MANKEIKKIESDKVKKTAELLNEYSGRTLTVNSRSLLDAFFTLNGMEKKSEAIRAAIADLTLLGEEKVKEKLINDVRMLPCKVETLLDFVSSKGSVADTVFSLEQYCGISPEYDKALEELKELIDALLVCGVPAEKLSVELCYAGENEFAGLVFSLGGFSGGFTN